MKQGLNIAMNNWFDFEPNFDPAKLFSRLWGATDKKDLLRLLLGFHVRFWRAPVRDMVAFLKSEDCWAKTISAVIWLVTLARAICRDHASPLRKLQTGIAVPLRFNHRVQLDLLFMWDKTWILIMGELIPVLAGDKTNELRLPAPNFRCTTVTLLAVTLTQQLLTLRTFQLRA